MQAYVNQLLEDIVTAHQQVPHKTTPEEPFSIEKHFEEVERWLASVPEYSFSAHCGLQPEQFPPVGRLTDEQLQLICAAFVQLMKSWNLDTDIPENFPLSKAYPLLITSLDEKVDIANDGFTTIEFCQYVLTACPFGEYCHCKDLQDENDEMPGLSNEDNFDMPF